jgi:hypothetical protein
MANRYRYADNRPTIKTDPTGLLSWLHGEPRIASPGCGLFSWTNIFSADPKVDKEGFIIQHVTVTAKVFGCMQRRTILRTTTCPTCIAIAGDTATPVSFYEIWQIKKDVATGRLDIFNLKDGKNLRNENFHDEWFFTHEYVGKQTSGWVVATGVVYFDEGKDGEPSGGLRFWKEPNITFVTNLLGSCKLPADTRRIKETGLAKLFYYQWDCCCFPHEYAFATCRGVRCMVGGSFYVHKYPPGG